MRRTKNGTLKVGSRVFLESVKNSDKGSTPSYLGLIFEMCTGFAKKTNYRAGPFVRVSLRNFNGVF